MNSKTILLLVTSIILALFSINTFAKPIVIIPDTPEIAAKGFVLMDYHSGEILTEQEIDTQMAPASLVKMMTSYVTGQELKKGSIALDDQVIISRNAWAINFPEASKMFLEIGKDVSVEQLNKGIIIQSGNDASVAMAEYIAGSESEFVTLMNAWAKSLNMTGTNFSNPHGLDDENLYTTPRDMALLAQALVRDVPEEYALYKEKQFTYNGITQPNRNGLLWDNSMNVDGIKTGHTDDAGYNLVSSATEGDMRLISVIMGTDSISKRNSESKKLLNYGFRFFETIVPHNADEVFTTERIWMGEKDTISLGVIKNSYVTLHRGQAQYLEASFVLEKELKAPILKGDVVGTISYSIDDKVIAEYPLVVLESVEKGGIFGQLWDYILLLFKTLLGNLF